MVLITFDIRIIAALIVAGLFLLQQSAVPFRIYKPLLLATFAVLLLNALFIFLLAPKQGVEVIGSETVLLELIGSYSLSVETVFYLLTVTLKYFSMFPIALVFVFTTHPSEFSASLNRIGVPYKIAYAVSLTLRYLPEIKNDFITIMHAQQARGVDLSSKASLRQRIKGVGSILGPLLFNSLDRADTISNAMMLRGFGRHQQRSWYNAKAMRARDYGVIVGAITVLCVLLYLRQQSSQLFWYPF